MSNHCCNDGNLKVSIITPSFNQSEFVERTILSVLCQDYQNIEYIVVDGLSEIETRSILHKYEKYIDVLIIEKDDGQSDALNKGFNASSGEILAYLNSDDCYSGPTVVSNVVRCFQEFSDADVIYGRRDIIGDSGFFVNCFPYRPFSKRDLYLADYIPQECAFWTRSIYEKAGSFISREFDFAMDYELWLRFLEFDAKFISVDKVFGLFRYYPSQKTHAHWQTKGLPEIAKLYQKYIGYHIPEQEMYNHFKEHVYGVNPSIYYESGVFCENTWMSFVELKTKLLRKRPLDQWVFRQEINPYRRR